MSSVSRFAGWSMCVQTLPHSVTLIFLKSFASYSCNSVLYYLQSSSNCVIVGMNGLHHACDFVLFLHAFKGHILLYENLYVDTFQTPLK